MRSGTGRISLPVKRRQSGSRSAAETAGGNRLARCCLWAACARPSGGLTRPFPPVFSRTLATLRDTLLSWELKHAEILTT